MTLKKGKTYDFLPMQKNQNGKTKYKNGSQFQPKFRATVIEVYPTYYLLVTPGGYKTTMLKTSLGIDYDVKKPSKIENKRSLIGYSFI